MPIIQFFEYLTEHEASHSLGLVLAGIHAEREVTTAARGRYAQREACLVGASPSAA